MCEISFTLPSTQIAGHDYYSHLRAEKMQTLAEVDELFKAARV